MVRGLSVSGLRRALDAEGFRSVQRPSEAALGMWRPEPAAPSAPTLWGEQGGGAGTPAMVADRRSSFAPPPQARAEPAYAPPPESTSFPLGVARDRKSTRLNSSH